MEVYGIMCKTSDVLNLDSSTEDKFSRHLIFNLKSAVFKDNLHAGTFHVGSRQLFFCQVWYKVLKSYCHCCLGRFIHAILQPVLSKLKAGTSHNDGVDNSDTRFVLVDQSYNSLLFWVFLLSTHLGIFFFHFSIDNREPDFSGGKPVMATETCGSPQAKRCKREEQDLQFLLVKSKDGQHCLFVDLGKKTQKWLTNLCLFSQYVIYKY